MGYYYYGGYAGYSYLIFILPAILISLFAQIRVKSAFSKYSKVTSPLNGFEAARRLLDSKGLSYVKIEHISGDLTDHFDPRTNTIRLSDSVYSSYSVAAVGVACHEAGHAIQYAENYAPIKLRNTIIPVTQIGSKLALPLILAGILFSFQPIAYLGIICFSLAVLFQLITLPVEFNASHRAITTIRECNLLYGDEQIDGAKKVLSAAAMTYVAALLVSLMQLLRLLLMVRGNRRN